MQVLVINRAVDTDRLAGFTAAARAHAVGARRLDAVDAHAPGFGIAPYRDLIGTHFWGEEQIKPGAIGCYLSHRAAWRCVAGGDAPWTLICEDDLRFDRGIADLRLPDSADLVFANDRMAAWARAAGAETVGAVVDALAQEGGPRTLGLRPAPGGDAYALTPRGARCLLAASARQKIVCGVDWAMIWTALGGRVSASAAAAFPELGILAEHLGPEPERLSAAVLHTPVGHLAGNTPSVLRHSVTVPVAALPE